MRYGLPFALGMAASALLVAPGCSAILGFQDFTTGSGGNESASTGLGGGGGGNSGSTSVGTGSNGSGHGGSSGGGGGSGTSGGAGSATGSNPTGSSGSGSAVATTASTSTTTTSTATSSGPPPSCTFASVPLPGGGTTSGASGATATEYYFSQGTFQQDGVFKTACGYAGTEPTTNGFESVDTVSGIANSSPASNTYFAAIPGNSSPGSNATDYTTFNTVGACGACVALSANGKTIIATIIDECPINSNAPCATAGHLDLSTSAFGALGFNQSQGGDPGGLSWTFVACPVTGGIQAMLNSAAQVYFQNAAFPITNVSVNGQDATLTVFGYWQLPANAAGATVTLTDVEMDSVTVTIPGNVASFPSSTDLDVQFPLPSGCSE